MTDKVRGTQQFQETPYFHYDLGKIEQRAKDASSDLFQIIYAVKANTEPSVVSLLSRHTQGVMVSTLHELDLIWDTAYSQVGTPIHVVGPNPSHALIKSAIERHALIHVQSLEVLSSVFLVKRMYNDELPTPKIIFRIATSQDPVGAGLCHGTKFGFDQPDITVELMDRVAENYCWLAGFSFYPGSQFTDLDDLVDAYTATFDQVYQLNPRPGMTVVFGGGWPTPYFNGDEELYTEDIVSNIELAMNEQFPRLWKSGATLCVDIGRHLVGDSGTFVTSVVSKKKVGKRTIIITDGGTEQNPLLRQVALKGKNFTISREDSFLLESYHEWETVDIYGPLHSPADLIATRVNLPPLVPGSRLHFENAGAYGAEFAVSEKTTGVKVSRHSSYPAADGRFLI